MPTFRSHHHVHPVRKWVGLTALTIGVIVFFLVWHNNHSAAMEIEQAVESWIKQSSQR